MTSFLASTALWPGTVPLLAFLALVFAVVALAKPNWNLVPVAVLLLSVGILIMTHK